MDPGVPEATSAVMAVAHADGDTRAGDSPTRAATALVTLATVWNISGTEEHPYGAAVRTNRWPFHTIPKNR